MTLRKNMTKGERQAQLERRVANLEMSTRVAQMLIQQIANNVSPMAKDLGELAGRQREMQYRILAAQELLALNADVLNKKAEELQIRDFSEASDKEDMEKGYTPQDEVKEDGIVIFTSKTPDETEEKGFLRSKLLVSEIGLPDLKAAFIGKKVGESFEADVNGVKHTITVLGSRAVPAPEPTEEVAAVSVPEQSQEVNG